MTQCSTSAVSIFIFQMTTGLQALMLARFRYGGTFAISLVISIAQMGLFKLGLATTGIEITGMIFRGPISTISASRMGK